MIILKRHNLRNLFILLMITLALFLLDDTKLKRYIGYEKVKEYIKEDINVFGVAKGFFGNKIFDFYVLDSPVNSTVIKENKYGKGYLVYQEDDTLYSSFVGSVVNVEKVDDLYNVTISKTSGNITIFYLTEVSVNIYQKIELNTVIGKIDGYYYYEEN